MPAEHTSAQWPEIELYHALSHKLDADEGWTIGFGGTERQTMYVGWWQRGLSEQPFIVGQMSRYEAWGLFAADLIPPAVNVSISWDGRLSVWHLPQLRPVQTDRFIAALWVDAFGGVDLLAQRLMQRRAEISGAQAEAAANALGYAVTK